MTTTTKTDDAELSYLISAVNLKRQMIENLQAVATARKARGADDFEILMSIDGELAILAGYQRAVDNRKRELGLGKGQHTNAAQYHEERRK